jgi:hypothetical protein
MARHPLLLLPSGLWAVRLTIVPLNGRPQIFARPLDTAIRRTACRRRRALLSALDLLRASRR